MFKCKSSNIDYLKYNKEDETLEVCFANGGVYHYFGVKESAYKAFEEADSHGKHFAKHIKDSFKFKKQEKKEKKDE